MEQLSSFNSSAALLITKALETFSEKCSGEAITDFHIIADFRKGHLSVVDDDDCMLAECKIAECQMDEDIPEYIAALTEALSNELKAADKEQAFEKVKIFKPFSFVLEDTERECIEELYIVDDDIVMVTPTLMEGLDSELDEFLAGLMND